MPEKTKPKEKDDRKSAEELSNEKDENYFSGRQTEKSYYYDDAHGYEIYSPDEDEDEDAE